MYGEHYSPAELQALQRAAAERDSVDAEIDAARVALMRLLASSQAEERPELVIQAVEAVVRSMRVRRQISGGSSRNIIEAADAILGELGLGGE
ncbi:MAG: hypothetical protein M3Q29_04895 [Chloroflexota bacterium]|nr:hypothetical protein [Chloroflexota bacterium]